MSFSPMPFDLWSALLNWGIVVGLFLGVAILMVLAAALISSKFNVGEAFSKVFTGFSQIGKDLFQLSWGRIWALTQLTIREAIRRKILLVFVVFGALFMFAGWFLADSDLPTSEQQVEVHVSVMLRMISWLTLPLVLLMSCWGIPQDIKNRAMHTVVTKPARRSEIYLGRLLGYSAVGTIILAVMAAIGYVWIVRLVPPSAKDALVARVPIYGDLNFLDPSGRPTKFGINVGDIWDFRSYISGATQAAAIWDFDDIDESDTVTLPVQSDDIESYSLDPKKNDELPPESEWETAERLQFETHFESFRTNKGDMSQGLLCRMRIVRDLRNRTARALGAGVSFQELTGMIDEGEFAQAATRMAEFSNGIETGALSVSGAELNAVAAGYQDFVNLMEPFVGEDVGFPADEFVSTAQAVVDAGQAETPDTKVFASALKAQSDLIREHAEALETQLTDIAVDHLFRVSEYHGDLHYVPRELYNETGEPVDLFDDLCHGGRLRVEIFCLSPGQYLGMARPDLFVRTPDRPFASTYFKAVTGDWLMILLVVTFGVTASTFVKGPVATLLTVTLVVVGVGFYPFLEKLVLEERWGSIESVKRIIDHKNPTVDLEQSRSQEIIEFADEGILDGLWVVYQTFPDFRVYSLAPYASKGFDVPWSAGLLPAFAMTLAYLIPCFLIGYLSLRFRELESK